MASTKPASTKAAAPGRAAKRSRPAAKPKRGPAARVTAIGAAKERLAAAKGMPGWRGARLLVGEALEAGATAILVGLEGTAKAVRVRRRVGDAWQPPEALAGDDAADVFAALARLGTTAAEDPGFVVAAGKHPARCCRVEVRKTATGQQAVVLVGREPTRPPRPGIGGLLAAGLGRLVPSFLRRSPPQPERDPTLPTVELEASGPDAAARTEAAAEAEGHPAACDLVAAAVRDRAGVISIRGGPQGVTAQFDVDGVATAAPVPAADVPGVVAVLRTIAGIDPKARGPQAARITALVQGKPWPCTVTARRGTAGELVEVVIDHVRPKFKTPADTGMPAQVGDRLGELLKLESGLVLVVAPPGGGLSTMFDVVINSTDRLLRDFVLLEDAAAPRPEIQNVKPVRWDSRAGSKPVAALETALREYPNVLATCDLEDADLARQLVAQAGAGRLVIAGVRGADAADGLARLVALGVEPAALARVLLGALGSRLVRKLCPRCRQEYLPPVEALSAVKLDPDAVPTLFRAPPKGCDVCTGTGYLGRTAACELAAGPTLQAYLGKGADAQVLRQAAVKDGTVPVRQDAVLKASRGVTSLEEVQRVFRKA